MSANQAQIPEVQVLSPGDYEEILALWSRAGLPARPEGRDAPDAFRLQYEGGLQRAIGIRRGTSDEGLSPLAPLDEGHSLDEGYSLVAVAILTHDGRKGWINRLAVDPAQRRQGYASILVAEAERWFRDEIGLEVFSALIHSHNDPSRTLFAELGYETIDVVYVRKLARPGA